MPAMSLMLTVALLAKIEFRLDTNGRASASLLQGIARDWEWAEIGGPSFD